MKVGLVVTLYVCNPSTGATRQEVCKYEASEFPSPRVVQQSPVWETKQIKTQKTDHK